MSLKPFRSIPKDLREWSRYLDDVEVLADDLSVDTSKIANNAVTYAKIQNVTGDRLLGRASTAGTVQEIAAAGGVEFAGSTIQRSALTGDVTATAGSNATTIANDTVTYAKLQNLSTGVLLGRTTAAAGDAEEITATAPLTLTALALGIDTAALLTALNIASGVYTPTLTNTTNVAASTANQCQYLRVGSVVSVSGKLSIDPTAVGNTVLGISLPVASNFGADTDCAGTAFASGIAGFGAAILGDAANDRMSLTYVAADISNQPLYFTATYRILP